MFERIETDALAELIKMDQRRAQRGYDWTQELIQPLPDKLSLLDRFLSMIGELLINAGKKLKSRSRAHLPAEQAKSPNFLIML